MTKIRNQSLQYSILQNKNPTIYERRESREREFSTHRLTPRQLRPVDACIYLSKLIRKTPTNRISDELKNCRKGNEVIGKEQNK